MKARLNSAYLQADLVSCGDQIGDFEVSHRATRVLTDTALKKFLSIIRDGTLKSHCRKPKRSGWILVFGQRKHQCER